MRKVSELPKRVHVGPTQTLPVEVRRLPRELNGQWRVDENGGEIFISSRAAKVQKHLTLFHELLHVTEEKLLIGGLIRKRSTEARIGHVATTLFAIMATSGLWKGVSPKEAQDFYARLARGARPRPRRRRIATAARSSRRS